MKLSDIKNHSEFILLTNPIEIDKIILDCYIGDLLSDVIANAKKGSLLITVLSNINTLAVAYLKLFPCIIITSNVPVDKEIINKANELNISIFSTSRTSFEVGIIIHKLLNI